MQFSPSRAPAILSCDPWKPLLHIHVPAKAVPLITALAPSLFAVYLLHANILGFGLMNQFVCYLTTHNIPQQLSFVLTAIVTIGTCLILNIPHCVVMRLL